MPNAKTLKAPPAAAAPASDADLEQLVSEVERQFTRQLVDLVDASTRGVLTLFPYTPRHVEPGKTYPAMTGHLDTRRVKIPVSAFAKRTEEGRDFLSLSIGPQGQAHIGGAMFRQEQQNPENGLWELAPGKENERFGLIGKTVQVPGTEDYDTVFELRFYGKRRLSGAGVPYIKAQVYPARKAGGEAEGAMAGCF